MAKLRQQPAIVTSAKSISAYYEGQNANGAPDHYVSSESAARLKATGQARSIHRGTAILIKGVRITRQQTRESVKSGWKVVGQTTKSSGPGFPHYGSVGKRD